MGWEWVDGSAIWMGGSGFDVEQMAAKYVVARNSLLSLDRPRLAGSGGEACGWFVCSVYSYWGVYGLGRGRVALIWVTALGFCFGVGMRRMCVGGKGMVVWCWLYG